MHVKSRQIAGMAGLILALFVAFFMTYKAELQDLIYGPVKMTMASVHKSDMEFDLILDRNNPSVTETFYHAVPDIKTISFRVNKDRKGQGGTLRVRLSGAGSGQTILEETYDASALNGEITLTLPSKYASRSEELLTLSIDYEEPGSTSLILTANTKSGFVYAYNGDTNSRNNVISEMTYSRGESLKKLFVILCVMLTLFALTAWTLLIIRGWDLSRSYLLLALFLGLIYLFLIPAYSVPDENIHIDNAYKYSNKILGVKDTGGSGMIHKRFCDVFQADLMANTLESNHYRQLADHLFQSVSPEEKELVEVPYIDTGVMVPAINYIPCALGISLGRLLGLSSLMVLSLGRYFSLVVFALLVSLSLKILPYGSNAAAMLMLLPIAIQQGTSASYDSVMNGMLLLFIACCLRYCSQNRTGKERQRQKTRGQYVRSREYYAIGGMIILLALYIVRTKGGVYVPLCFMIPLAFWGKGAGNDKPVRNASGRQGPQDTKAEKQKKRGLLIAGIAALGIICILVFIRAFWSFLLPMFNGVFQAENGSGHALFNLLAHPFELCCKYWNTFQRYGETYLRDLMGGILSWQDIHVNRLYPLCFLAGTILLAHTDHDRFNGDRFLRIILSVIGVMCVLLVMLSMLVAFTKPGLDYISGVQGRYFLSIALLFFLGGTTGIIHVDRQQASATAMAMMFVEVLTILSVITKV